ncbi:MAG: glycosyltransferase family 4 protein [Armatimonadota bacterium]|nr:glycosyltransferase family 4 protein [bacterium]MDW8320000.1 glycosyltransferase family 4 protein [Armatimonadota bacterium]
MSHSNSFDKNRIRVLMFAPALELPGGMSSYLSLVLRFAPAEVEVVHVPTWSAGKAPRRFALFAVAVLRLLYLGALRRVDLVHLHFAKGGSVWRKFFLTRVAHLFRLPTLLHAHSGAFPDFYQSQGGRRRRWIACTAQQASRLVVLSEQWKGYYQKTLGVPEAQIEVLPNPVDLPAALPDRSGREVVTFVFLGKIDENKGAHRLIDAVALLPESTRRRVRFILAGHGAVEAARRQASSLNLPEVTVLGWVRPDQRETLLAEGDVLVLPSLREGLPMSILEAMSWALPVVATPVGGIPEFVHDGWNGLLVPPTDIAALCAAIQQLADNEPLRLQMGANARASVEHLDIRYYWQRLLGIYRNVLTTNESR